MLTLLPLSGLHSALKRRNSKTIDFSRRGSISVYSTYSLPNSKNSMRRFSSYEELAPIFHLLSNDGKQQQPKSSLSLRRSKRSAPAATTCNSDASCADLDAQIARIKGQLVQLKNEDLEMSQRVEDLSSSVESLYNERVPTTARVEPSPPVHLRPRSSLGAIHEKRKESDSDSEDEQSFEDYCRGLSKMVRKFSVPCFLPFREVDIDPSAPSPKDHCIPNNILQPKAKSTPRLDIIRNDLSKHDAVDRADQRLSIVSCQSDSILFTSRHRSIALPFEETTDVN